MKETSLEQATKTIVFALVCCRTDDGGATAKSTSSAFLWIWMGLGVRSAKTISDSVSVTNELAQAQPGL